ncbi:Mrp/NBP35 family ATP-binding protein [Thioalbus denitrificans]|uniref:Iron-sulfur cluster carrier protein n=1 Tax=Thioalbus denitrificans TaxID=547122 RepID=A0A369CDH7_9GAMM|nr:Mrp/NBP35 family ATP-binding protein [Thioalbus denitrificans]RCX31185.1 ATP-binding protein involved in chromosome partitioning [Thioalbus denitrificans]
MAGIGQVEHVVAVASGKGGVGKTTVAINLALGLAARGFSVGLLDADVYGPSIPLMLGISTEPVREGDALVPVEKFGLLIMSIGFLVDEAQPVIWRGPMVSRAVKEFLDQVAWGRLDCLVVDLPPGTGDPSITIARSIPAAEVVMVTTPQAVAVADVRRAIHLFQRLGNPVTGIVENMAGFRAAPGAAPIDIFGAGGGEALSRETGIPLLGSIPIEPELRAAGDAGAPILIRSPDNPASLAFGRIAEQVKRGWHIRLQ